jgi:hypothetical protein
VGAAALRAFAQTAKEESQLSGTGLEVSPGLTVSREREIRHWRPMIVRDTLPTLMFAYLLSQPAFTGYACHLTGRGDVASGLWVRIRRAGPR